MNEWTIGPSPNHPSLRRIILNGEVFALAKEDKAAAFEELLAAFEELLAAARHDDDLPEGVRPGYVLDADTPMPEGWRSFFITSPPFDVPTAVERIPAPATVKVHWRQAIGRTLPDGREITGAWMSDDGPRVGITPLGVSFSTAHDTPRPDADGYVDVLAQDDER